jgi:hypothetical protein
LRPLGSAVDSGWHRNLFGGPCFFAKVSALPFIDEATQTGGFDAWTVYAALACGGLTMAMVPEPLYTTPDDARAVTLRPARSRGAAVSRATAGGARSAWIFKAAYAALNGSAIATTARAPARRRAAAALGLGKSLYERFTNLPDAELRGFAELDPSWASRIRSSGFRHAPAPYRAARGAMEHDVPPGLRLRQRPAHAGAARGVPALGRFVAGFIDRRPDDRVLGKPCVRPEQFRDEMADVILYSSREFELDMHARLASARVEHVLLYHDSPAAPPADIVTRLGNRFGHRSVGSEGLDVLEASRPAWVTGSIGLGDALFLFEMIHAQAPRAVLELGVGAGGSSASLCTPSTRCRRSTAAACSIRWTPSTAATSTTAIRPARRPR